MQQRSLVGFKSPRAFEYELTLMKAQTELYMYVNSTAAYPFLCSFARASTSLHQVLNSDHEPAKADQVMIAGLC